MKEQHSVLPKRAMLWAVLASCFALPSRIVAAPLADASYGHAPRVETTANGLPLVQITTPSAAGVSHNQYQRFDVDPQGLILNNSRVITPTQQAGYVDGNPNLAGGTARIILNEVTSTAASALRGYAEVAGDRAEVVIANPNGLTCNGCGFINTSRGVLTTGTPVFGPGGSLEAFRVTGGQIALQGAGLNTAPRTADGQPDPNATVDRLDLLSRAVAFNAQVWAKELNVVTGAQEVGYVDLGTRTLDGAGERPAVSLDVSSLGGMYADRIRLIGTEAGLGVVSAGEIVGDAVEIDQAGRVVLNGATRGKTVYIAAEALDNGGTLTARTALTANVGQLSNAAGAELSAASLRVTAADSLRNAGLIDGRDVRLDAAILDNTDRLYGDRLALQASTFTNAPGAVIAARETLDLGVGTLFNGERAWLYSQGNLALGGALDEQGRATGSADAVRNGSATIAAAGNMSIAANSLINYDALFDQKTMVDEPETTSFHVEYQADGSPRVDSSAIVWGSTRRGAPKIVAPFDAENYYIYSFTRTTREQQLLGDLTPGRLLAGGNLALQGEVSNDKSQIIAGGDIHANADDLHNIALELRKTVEERGTVEYSHVEACWRGTRERHCRETDPPVTYAPGPILTYAPVTDSVVYKKGEAPPADQPDTASSAAYNNGALFRWHSEPGHAYLIETDPRFTNYRAFLSSDYMLERLGLDQPQYPKRLGDGFVEQQRLRDQLIQLAGRPLLEGYANAEAQFRALMEEGVASAERLELVTGVALTEAQMASLTHDIVWMVEQPIERPDGQTERVLAPVVYLTRAKPKDVWPSGLILAGESINLKSNGTLSNSGQIKGGLDVILSADRLSNDGGLIESGRAAMLSAQTDLVNASGRIQGEQVALAAGRDLTLTTRTLETQGESGSRVSADRVGVIYGGSVTAQAGRDLTVAGAELHARDDAHLSAGRALAVDAVETGQTLDVASHIHEQTVTQLGSTIQTGGNLTLHSGGDTTLTAAQLVAGGNIALKAENGSITLDTAANTYERDDVVKGGYLKEETTRQQRTTLQAGGNVSAIAGQDIAITAARLSAGQDIALQAAGDINVTAVLYRDVRDAKTTQEGRFGRSKTARDMSDKERVVSTEFAANNLSLQAGNDMLLEAVNAQVAQSTTLAAQNDLTLTAKAYREAELHTTQRRGALGLNNSESRDASQSTRLAGSDLKASGNLLADAGKDLRIIAGTVHAEGDIVLRAGDAVQLDAGLETAQHEHGEQKRSFLTGGEFMQDSSALDGQIDQTAKGTRLAAGGRVSVDAERIRLTGSDVDAGQAIALDARSGDIELASAEESHTRYSQTRTVTVGLGDALETLTDPTGPVKTKDGRLSVTVGDAAYDDTKDRTVTTTQRGSTLTSGGDLALAAGGDIVLTGAQVNAAGDASLKAEGDVVIQEALETKHQTSKETHGTAEASVGVKHQAVEVVKAVQALLEADKKLKKAKKAYDSYRDDLKSYDTQLASLTERYNNHEPGITQADVQEFQQLLRDLREDEKYYKLDLAAATANATSKTTLLVQQIAATAQSASLWGFNADLQLDIDAVVSRAESYVQQAKASQIQAGGNLAIASGGDTTVRGSQLQAGNRLDIAAQNLNLQASGDTFEGNSSQDHAHGNLTVSVFGAGPQFSLDVDTSRSRSRESQVNNTQLGAANISIATRDNAVIEGANVHAGERLTMDIGRDLILASQQDTASGKSRSLGLSAGYGGGSASGGASSSSSRYSSRQTVLTSLTGNSVDIDVGRHTDLTGALIAAIDEQGNDNGRLALSTQTLSYQDLRDTAVSRERSMGLSASVGASGTPATKGARGERLEVNSSNLNYANKSHLEAGKTLATIGRGNLTVRDQTNGTDLSLLNRDTQATDLDLYAIDRQQGNVEMTLDHRLLSAEGRAQIGQEMQDSGKNLQIIAQNVPGETGGNAIENAVGKVLNLLNSATLGVTPSADSDGGMIAQLPVLLGADDIKGRPIHGVHVDNDYVKQHPDEFMPIENLPGYTNLTPEQRREYRNLVVNKHDYAINAETATYQNFTNGIMNSPLLAVINGQRTTFGDDAGANVNFTVNYNPTHGLIGDLLESGVDKFVAPLTGNRVQTSVAQQTGEFLRDVAAARGKQGFNNACHSQGCLLVNSGLNYVGREGFEGINFVLEAPTFGIYGSAVNSETMETTVEEIVRFKYRGSKTHEGDFVGERLGGNKGVDGQRSALSRVLDVVNPATYVDMLRLFLPGSPHSAYQCNELPNARCGDRP